MSLYLFILIILMSILIYLSFTNVEGLKIGKKVKSAYKGSKNVPGPNKIYKDVPKSKKELNKDIVKGSKKLGKAIVNVANKIEDRAKDIGNEFKNLLNTALIKKAHRFFKNFVKGENVKG